MTLKEYRESLGLSQRQMADKLGVHQPSLSRAEKSWPNVGLRLAFDISRVFNVRLMIYPEGRAAFMTPEQIAASDSEGCDLSYLPDVLVGPIADKFKRRQKTNKPITCCSPEGVDRCTRAPGKSDGVLMLINDVPTCPCGLQHSIDLASLA